MSYSGYPSQTPQGPPKFNPDTRPLPDGWITQYDTTYNAWFYVNTRASPPKSEWKHPADLQPQQPFAPPGGPPPSTGGSAQSYYQGTPSPSPYPQQQQPYPGGPGGPGGYSPYPANSPYPASSPYPQQQQPYQQTPAAGGSSTKGPMGALAGAGAGGLLGKLFSHGSKPQGGSSNMGGGFGGYGGGGGYGQPGYGQPVYGQQPVYAAPQKKSNAGRNAMLAGGGGLLGGFLLADAIDDMGDDRREEQAYDQGYQDGDDNDYGGGDDFGGDF